jgi:hypothetical protein
MVANFAYEVPLSYSQGFLTCRKLLRHGTDDFTSPPKEVVLRTFIALKNQLSFAGFEPANLGFSGKDANNCSTEATLYIVNNLVATV